MLADRGEPGLAAFDSLYGSCNPIFSRIGTRASDDFDEGRQRCDYFLLRDQMHFDSGAQLHRFGGFK